MRRAAALLAAVAAALGCSGGGGGTGTGTAGTGGGGGAGGSGTGGGGGDPTFQVVAPCDTEIGYVTGETMIAFGAGEGNSYNPQCLQVAPGTTVTFAGEFGTHPLMPSAARGTLTGNPIVATSAGSTASFTFPTAGYWAYYCAVHGSDADGQFMSGVIRVK